MKNEILANMKTLEQIIHSHTIYISQEHKVLLSRTGTSKGKQTIVMVRKRGK